MTWLRRRHVPDTGTAVTLTVQGMHCASCGLLVDDELEDVPGVSKSSTDVRSGRAVVRFTSEPVDPALLLAAVERAGYRATVAD